MSKHDNNNLAEIYSPDELRDGEVENIGERPEIEVLKERIKSLEQSLFSINHYIGMNEPRGLRELIEGKNEFDVGHNHLFPPKDVTVIQSFFESKDGWASGGVGTEVITQQIGGISIATGASTNDDAWILATTTGFNSFDVSQASSFQTVMKFSAATSITGYFGVGDITAGGAFGAANEEGYGFKYVSGTLSALTVKNGAETLTTINNITATNFNEYRAIFSGKSVRFYVNGKIVATHSAGIPDTDDDIFGTFYVKTTTTAARTLYAKYFYFTQQNA